MEEVSAQQLDGEDQPVLRIKNDNCKVQYKCGSAFSRWQQRAIQTDCTVIIYYGVPGHGKGRVDAMGTFGVKVPIKRQVIVEDVTFTSAQEIIDLLQKIMIGDSSKRYSLISAEASAARRNKDTLPIKGISEMRMLAFFSDGSVQAKVNVCSCDNCKTGNFAHCRESVKGDFVHSAEYREDASEDNNAVYSTDRVLNMGENDCDLDEENTESGSQMFEFVDVSSFVAVVSCITSEPVYIIQIEEKGVAHTALEDRYGHVILPGELYLKGHNLELSRSKRINFKQFRAIAHDVYCPPDEVYEAFL